MTQYAQILCGDKEMICYNITEDDSNDDIVSVDVEEGVGNAHPNHSLPNSTPAGHGPPSPSKSSEADDGDDEDKSVLQAKLTNLAIQVNTPL